jgi:hypothetical protein
MQGHRMSASAAKIRGMEASEKMKKLLFFFPAMILLPLFLFVSIPAKSQDQIEHAPTPEQCRADAAAWDIPEHLIFEHDAFEKLVNMHSDASARVLDARRAELAECEKTDRMHATRYSLGATAYVVAEMIRLGDFMHRHNRMDEFYKEDDQGKR